MDSKPPTIDLYTSGTPNGQKASCLLHELNLPYNLHAISLSKNEQKEPEFLAINPNGRIPAIVDKTDVPSGRRLFESGALMLYLCEKYDKQHRLSFAYGQANHFYRYAPEKVQYGINRYQTETRRLYQAEWAGIYEFVPREGSGGDGGKFKHVKRWLDVINSRPDVQAGLNVPSKFEMKEAMQDKESEEAYARMHSNWVMQGQKDEQAKHV
ncbi:MAG: hypothetical protein Q9162_005190 [Coniocarpon cinnabarinum]